MYIDIKYLTIYILATIPENFKICSKDTTHGFYCDASMEWEGRKQKKTKDWSVQLFKPYAIFLYTDNEATTTKTIRIIIMFNIMNNKNNNV